MRDDGGTSGWPWRALRRARSLLPGPRFVEAPAAPHDLRAAYERDGFVAGGPVLDPSELGALRAEFDRLFDTSAPGASAAAPRQERVPEGAERSFHRVVDLHKHSAAFLRVVTHPRLVALLVELTGLPALRVLMDQVQYKPPRVGGRNAWHRDMPSFPLVRPYTGLTAWIALDDATKDTGCMRMVPGSHRFGDATDLAVEGDGWGLPGVGGLREYRGHAVRVEARPVRAGEVHFHHEMTWHGSGRNRTRHKRRALAIHYVGADVRYRPNGRTSLAGLREGDRLEAVAPIVVSRTAVTDLGDVPRGVGSRAVATPTPGYDRRS